jgi:conjugative transposon TraK protein
MSINRPVEAREHVRRFHELFFTIAPDKNAIESNVKRAFNLADQSAFNYYKDLQEKGYYNRIISGNIQQRVEVDSVVANFDSYPYDVKTYARQFIIRSSNLTIRNLVTNCSLVNSVRSDSNPQGFIIEKFNVLENRDVETVER